MYIVIVNITAGWRHNILPCTSYDLIKFLSYTEENYQLTAQKSCK